ncbi:MAG: DNA methyltransferase [Promethearchaeota archaeon]
MAKHDRLITLKEAVIYSNHVEENIRLQIERGALKKYDKKGNLLEDPLRVKGFFKLSELMSVYDIKDPEAVKKRFLSRKIRRDSAKNINPKTTVLLRSFEMNNLKKVMDNSIDTWILSPRFTLNEKEDKVTYSEISKSLVLREVHSYLKESQRILRPKGNVIIHSIPRFLPYFGLQLNKLGFFFKYWIVYPKKNSIQQNLKKFVPLANGILYYVKSPKNFRINRVRIPYRHCSFCNEPLKDYGGKKHLRHVDGMVLSDIWHLDHNPTDQNLPSEISSFILRRLIDLSCTSESSLLLAPFDGEISNEF